jgi:hypothetical protein
MEEQFRQKSRDPGSDKSSGLENRIDSLLSKYLLVWI